MGNKPIDFRAFVVLGNLALPRRLYARRIRADGAARTRNRISIGVLKNKIMLLKMDFIGEKNGL